MSRESSLVAIGIATVALIACNADSIVSLGAGQRDRRVSASVGERIEVTLQTVGGGEYASPPAISSASVEFVDVTAPPGTVGPAGVAQLFRLRAVSPGVAVLTFTHTGTNPTVQDTIDVR